MTYDEIKALEEGPEMDVAVAEGIMGECAHIWREEEPENACPECGRCSFPDTLGSVRCVKCEKRAAGLYFRVDGKTHGWPYSTDDVAMLRLTDEMIAKGKEFELYHDSEGWSCHFTGTGLVYEETRGMAVCRAALLATFE